LMNMIVTGMHNRKCLSTEREKQFAAGDVALLLKPYDEAFVEGVLAGTNTPPTASNIPSDALGITTLVCRHLALLACGETVFVRNEKLWLQPASKHDVTKPWRGWCYYPSREALLWLALCLSEGRSPLQARTVRQLIDCGDPVVHLHLVYANPLS